MIGRDTGPSCVLERLVIDESGPRDGRREVVFPLLSEDGRRCGGTVENNIKCLFWGVSLGCVMWELIR